MSGNQEWRRLQAAADDGSAHRAWSARWDREFRSQRWVEYNGAFWPRPGWEPEGFSAGDRMARDNAMRLELARSRKLDAAIERAKT